MRNVNRIREADPGYYRDYVCFLATLTPPSDLTQIDEFLAGEQFANNTVSANFMETYDTGFFEKYTCGMESHVEETLTKLKRDYVEARAQGRAPSKLAVALLDQAFIRLYRRKPERLNETIPLNGCCMPGVRRVFVTADGLLYPCEKVESKEFMIGHVDSGVDPNLVAGVVATYAEKSIGDCADCWASRLCSMCHNSAKHGGRFDIARKRERCEPQRTTWHATLQMYTTILEDNPKAFDFVKDLYIE
jgi:radical SAM protein with 4Fe4S-binding SPASM domain